MKLVGRDEKIGKDSKREKKPNKMETDFYDERKEEENKRGWTGNDKNEKIKRNITHSLNALCACISPSTHRWRIYE